MSNPLVAAGALGPQSKYAPLHTNRFFTGLWTQRNPLRDAATSYLQEKFYGGSRFDSLIDGANAEITSRLTLARRPGHSVYNSQTFPAVNRFYEFRAFSAAAEVIRVMADTAGVVYDATGPSTKTALFNKAAGAGATSFQSVGNLLLMGDGAETKKWVQSAKSWSAGAQFAAGDFFVDSGNNLQVAVGAQSQGIASIAITGNVCTLIITNQSPLLWAPGVKLTLAGLTTATFLNGQAVPISSVNPNRNTITFPFVHADYAAAADTGTATTAGGVTGGAQPAWSSTLGGVTADGAQQWICKGSSVQNWGIAPPSSAPAVSNANRPAPYPNWAPNTFYSPSVAIIDSNSNLQMLTTGGITGASAPTWNVTVGGTTADGTAVWTNKGPAIWQASHAQNVGDLIMVTWTYWISVWVPGGASASALLPLAMLASHNWHAQLFALMLSLLAVGIITITQDGGFSSGHYESQPVTVTAMFRCVAAGNTGAAHPDWQDGVGAVVTDGTVTWQNMGDQKTWTDIGASTSVSLAQTVIDTNGNKQQIITPGKSGASAPTWATATGSNTPDGTALWQNAGLFSGAQTKAWLYSYAGRNSVTGEVSTAAPASASIVMAANKLINVQGNGFADTQVDVIDIYRTPLGGSTLELLDQILAPANGAAWSYQDASDDSALLFTIQAVRSETLGNNPPPSGLVALAYHLGRVWGAVGNTVYCSGGPDTLNGNGNSAFPPANSFVFPSRVTRLIPTTLSGLASSQSASALLVFTVSDVYIILGRGTPDNTFYPLLFRAGIGLLNYDALAMFGAKIFMLTTARKLIVLDVNSAGDPDEPGFPIGDQFKALFDPSTAFVTWHEGSSDDSALFVADGTTGWFRMAQASMPEVGTIWSPRAQIVGGCHAVSSVEVAPGITKLLVGPATNGPILQRDTSVNTDNLQAFSAFATIGSIVMAQGGQRAELEFITLVSAHVGTRPGVSILLNEISGKFRAVKRTHQDIPNLPPNQTLYSDRYVFQQDQSATVCQHFQWRLDWAAEDAHNELLTYTIFGSMHQEKHS